MSTSNFWSMEHYPIFARDFYTEVKKCPQCGCYSFECFDADKCDYCGEDLSTINTELIFDELLASDICNDINLELKDINKELTFNIIELKSGYYTGVQFYVSIKDFFEDKNGELDLSNEEAHYFYDMCRSQARKQYKIECNKINKILEKLGSKYYFKAYEVAYRFSNGETGYTEITLKKVENE